jgi:transposase
VSPNARLEVRFGLADQLDYVVGVDPHRDSHALAVVEVIGGAVVFEATVAADSDGYANALRLVDAHAPGRRAFAVEGTGSFGCGLTRFLGGRGERVLEFEVGRLRRERRSGGKTDALDAIHAARSVLATGRLATLRAGGERQALQALVAAPEGAVNGKRAGLCQLRDPLITTPEPPQSVWAISSRAIDEPDEVTSVGGEVGHAAAMIEHVYRDNGTAHRDVVLRFGSVEKLCDSYYFALDTNLRDGGESPAKVMSVIGELLRQWERDVAALAVGATAYLPYDLSDQYSGWPQAERDADRIGLALGWTEPAMGSSFNASDYGPVTLLIGTLQPSDASPRFEIRRDELLAAIRANLTRYEVA